MGAGEGVSDESLLAAYSCGDMAAFEMLFRRYQAPLRRHLESMLNDGSAAEDIVIETFERLHRHRHRFRPGANVRPWIYTIARNLARNRRRDWLLHRWVSLGTAELERERTQSCAQPGTEEEIRQRVTAAFAALPRQQREVCSLRLFGELSLEEIARATGSSLGTVKSRLFYGQRRLRELLADLVA